jgi:hypothetical protein
LVGAESLTIETVFGVEFHETCEVRSLVVPSLQVPIAVNCSVVNGVIEELLGKTLMALSTTCPPDVGGVPPLLLGAALPPPHPASNPKANRLTHRTGFRITASRRN